MYVCAYVRVCACACVRACAHMRRVLKGHLQCRGTSVASLLSLGDRLKTSGVQSSL